MPGVKVGDLVITKNCKHSGILMEIIDVAPATAFMLPNGQFHCAIAADSHPAWVVKLLSGPFPVEWSDGTTRPATWGVAQDRCVYPLPADPVEVDSEQTAEA